MMYRCPLEDAIPDAASHVQCHVLIRIGGSSASPSTPQKARSSKHHQAPALLAPPVMSGELLLHEGQGRWQSGRKIPTHHSCIKERNA